MNEVEHLRRAEQARQIIESPVWIEAWETYRERTLQLIESADSNETEKVMQAKRLLAAGTAARKHLEALLVEGKMAAAQVVLDEQRKKRWGII